MNILQFSLRGFELRPSRVQNQTLKTKLTPHKQILQFNKNSKL